MRRAVPHFVAAAASLAPLSRASVGIGLRRHSGSSAPTEAQQTALLEHYAMGLREILAETDNLSAPAVVDRLRALRERAPVALERPFWGAQFLAMAFGHEMGFAAANPPALRAIFDLAAAAAERGLVPFQSVRAAHGQLKQLGLLTCDVVDPPWSAAAPRSALDRDDETKNAERPVTAWSLFASARFRAAASELARALEADGVAVVDGALGERHATAVGSALRAFRERERRRFQPGALDRTGRSNAGARGDVVAWLAGDEGLAASAARRRGERGETRRTDTTTTTTTTDTKRVKKARDAAVGSRAVPPLAFPDSSSDAVLGETSVLTAGVVAQWARSCLGSHLLASLPRGTLLPTDAYVANAMLSAYAPGAPGFVPHTDCASPSDPRRVTAIYYPARGETPPRGADLGGELVIRPRDSVSARRRTLEPRGDRLVAFWSDEVEHEVRGVKRSAREERLAVSFWFLKPPTAR